MEITIKLDKAQVKKKGHPLILYIYVSAKDKLKRYTGYYSNLEHWDFNKEEPKKSHPLYFGIMDFILEMKQKINSYYNLRKKMSAQQIYEYLNGKDDDLYHFWELRISEMENANQIGNAKFYKGYLKNWKSYKKEIKFSEIDYNFLTKFKLHKKKTCGNNAINIYLKAIQAIYNEAVRRGVYVPNDFRNPFTGMKEKAEITKDKNLTIEEMKKIIQTPEQRKMYKIYYDSFLLLFYFGGIDFVDLANLKKEHLRNGRIKFVRFKGGTNEIIDNFVFPEAEEILKKYENPESDFLMSFPNIKYLDIYRRFMVHFREYLKTIGVKSYFSSKSARYTFINIGKELQLNRDVIMELTGHARNDTHAIYEGKFPNQIKDEVHRKIIDAIL